MYQGIVGGSSFLLLANKLEKRIRVFATSFKEHCELYVVHDRRHENANAKNDFSCAKSIFFFSMTYECTYNYFREIKDT